MPDEHYTTGYSRTAIQFMGRRSAQTHAEWFLGEIDSGMSLLDVGCGPGTITVGLAHAVAPGEVHGIDMSDDQFELGRKLAAERGLTVSFHRGSAYELPFEDWSFDAVFAHALLEHLRDPVGALSEMGRVLRPGGLIGACSPDWGGFIVTPPSDALSAALADYRALKTANGWNPLAGRYLGEWMLAASLTDVRLGAYYEQYTDRTQIASLLGEQLNAGGRARSADTLRSWLNEPGAMFAQAWVYAVGRGRNQFSGRPARPGVPSQTSL